MTEIREPSRQPEPDLATPPRPTKVDKNGKHRAAEAIFEELKVKCGFSEAQRSEAIRDLVKYGKPDEDGYHFAKTLDLYCGWNCDFTIAEVLNEWQNELDQSLSQIVTRWVMDNEIWATIAPGSRVRVKSGETGRVIGPYQSGITAEYKIHLDGDNPLCFRLANYEDVELI